MMTLAELNNFIISHADVKYFEADVKLYKKHFPNSRLIPELEKAPEYSKKALDERMIYELLNNQDSCIDCIWENRGYIRNGEEKILPLPTPPTASNTQPATTPQPTNLAKAKYNVLKKLVFEQGLQSKCPDQKKATYLKVLMDQQVTANAKPAAHKKKEDRAASTQK